MRLTKESNALERIDFPDAHVGDGFGLPFSALGRNYYSAVSGSDFRQHSFLFSDSDGIAASVECDNSSHPKLTRFGSPIHIWLRSGLSQDACRKVTRDIISELATVGRDEDFSHALIQTSHVNDPLGMVAARLIKEEADAHIEVRSQVLLTFDDDDLLRDLRKGHRQQVRWGEKNLAIQAVDKSNPDREQFNAFKTLHAEVAGRVTRAPQSWEITFDAICRGEGDLILALLDGTLIGGTLILDAGDCAYYASGAYRRDYFDKPLSHFPLFCAFQRARARGRKRFDVGMIFETGKSMDDKERAIANFKSGFTSHTSSAINWTHSLGAK